MQNCLQFSEKSHHATKDQSSILLTGALRLAEKRIFAKWAAFSFKVQKRAE